MIPHSPFARRDCPPERGPQLARPCAIGRKADRPIGTQYGGDTPAPAKAPPQRACSAGTATRQKFHADAHTSTLIPAAKTNVWTVEVHPGRAFVYALRREGTDRRFRIEFDLTTRTGTPPAPWGAH